MSLSFIFRVFCTTYMLKFFIYGCYCINVCFMFNKDQSINRSISIAVNWEKISRVFQTKFLGIIIQADLKWTSHTRILVNKISKTVGIINKVKYVLTTAHLKLLYQSLVEPYLNYCCIVWASPVKSNSLESLYKLQKRVVKVISFPKYRDHSKPLFYTLDILNIYLLCLCQILIFVYKSLNSLLSSHCTNYFIKTADVHRHKTRGIENWPGSRD